METLPTIDYQPSMETLPEDVRDLIFLQLDPEQRAAKCSVSSQWCRWIITLSMRLSPRPELYTWNPYRKLPREMMSDSIYNDCHLVIRLRRSMKINLSSACVCTDTIDVLLRYRANTNKEVGKALIYSCKLGNLSALSTIMDCEFPLFRPYITGAMRKACSQGRIDIINKLFPRWRMEKQVTVSDIAFHVGKGGFVVFRLLMDKGGGFERSDIVNILRGSCKRGCTQLAKIAIELIKADQNTSEMVYVGCFEIACENGHPELFELLLPCINGVWRCLCGRSLHEHMENYDYVCYEPV